MTPYGAVAMIFAISGASFGTWASRIPHLKSAGFGASTIGYHLVGSCVSKHRVFSSSWTSYGSIWSRTGQ